MAQPGKPISYEQLVERAGVEFFPRTAMKIDIVK